jgi:formate-dependent nitrite reductase cytochrome c552 subunit
MVSVTRDKKKYGAPTVYDKHKKKKVEEEIREADFRADYANQERSGMIEPQYGSGGHRKKPVRYD